MKRTTLRDSLVDTDDAARALAVIERLHDTHPTKARTITGKRSRR